MKTQVHALICNLCGCTWCHSQYYHQGVPKRPFKSCTVFPMFHQTSNFNCLHVQNVCAVPTECPAGMFGLGCRHRCQCDNKALCDHVSGACTCQVGWTGTFCEKGKISSLNRKLHLCLFVTDMLYLRVSVSVFSACPQDFYGPDCQEKCLCLNGGSCDHISGVCSCSAGWIGPLCNQSELQLRHRRFLNKQVLLPL